MHFHRNLYQKHTIQMYTLASFTFQEVGHFIEKIKVLGSLMSPNQVLLIS